MKIFLTIIIFVLFVSRSFAQVKTDNTCISDILEGKVISVPGYFDYTQNQSQGDFYCNVLIIFRQKIIEKIELNELDSVLFYTKPQFAVFSKNNETDSIYVLTLREREFIDYLNRNYSPVLSRIVNRKPVEEFSNLNEIRKSKDYFRKSYYAEIINDSLSAKLCSAIIRSKEEVNNNIKESGLDAYKKDFLILLLEYKIYQTDMCNECFEKSCLTLSDKYLSSYGNNEFTDYIKETIGVRYKKGNWGYGFCLSSGLIIPTKSLSGYFTPVIPISMTMELNYKRFYLSYFNLDFGFRNTIKKSFEYNNVLWQKNDKLWFNDGHCAFGYNVVMNHKLNVIPNVGFIGMGFFPHSKSDSLYYKDAGLIGNETGFMTFGVIVDYKFGYRSCSKVSYFKNRIKEENFGYIRFGVNYLNPRLGDVVDGMNGNLIFFNLGIGTYVRTTKKIRQKIQP